MNNHSSFKKRLSYWFDNKMAQGFGPKIRLLLIVTIIFVVIIALLAALSHGGIYKNFISDFIRTFMYSLGKGGALNSDDTKISVIYFILMLLTIIYCMFFTAILIGLINNALRTKVEDLGKGRSNVVENNHILILGFNDATFILLKELIEANKNQNNPQTIVVLGMIDQKNMIDQIHKRIDWPKRRAKTRIICRTGSTYNFDDLKRCSIETCRSVIINASNDFDSIKAIMACSYIINEKKIDTNKQPFFVSIIQNEENLLEAKHAVNGSATDALIILALNDVLARIMVHTSRQPGLSDVFTELFNFLGSELYLFDNDPCFPQFYGKTISDINQMLRTGFAVGVKKPNSEIIIDQPLNTIFEQGDSLIVVALDDNPLWIAPAQASTIETPKISSEQSDSTNVLIIGVAPVLESALREYSNYLTSGSSICVVDHKDQFHSIVEENTLQSLSDNNIDLSVETFDPSRKKNISILMSRFEPDCVLVLANEDAADQEAEDEFIMRTLIYLREYRSRSSHYFSITCEMLRSKDKDLAAATGPDDFIISRHFAALMTAQISQNKEMAPLFETLLSNTGFEVYMKPAYWYVNVNSPINLFDVSRIVAERGEIFIGIRQKENGKYKSAEINPMKIAATSGIPTEYVFSEDDYFIVLSATSSFPEYTGYVNE